MNHFRRYCPQTACAGIVLLIPALLSAEPTVWKLTQDNSFTPASLRVPDGFSIDVAAPPPPCRAPDHGLL